MTAAYIAMALVLAFMGGLIAGLYAILFCARAALGRVEEIVSKSLTSATGDSGADPDPAPVSLSVQEGQGEALGASGARRVEEGQA